MRWLIFFLLVLNVLTFSWFTFQENQQTQLADRKEINKFDFSSVPTLQLLAEVDPAEKKLRDIRNVKVLEVIPETVIVNPLSVSAAEDDVIDNIEEENGAQVEVLRPTYQGNCMLIGSFPEMVTAKQAKGRLEKRGIETTVVLVLKQLPAINWVYIAPQNSRKEALAILKRLQDDKIDSFLIADGEYKNGISLGFFSKLESAGAVMKERRRQGYEVSITRKIREQKTFWVAFDEETSLKVDEDLVNSLKGEVSDLKKQEKSCQDVALLQIIE